MTAATQAITASALSSILGLIGGFLILAQYDGVKRVSHYLVSFAAGALLGAAFFDVLTEGIAAHPQEVTKLFGWVMGGFLFFFLIEKALLWHHHAHNEEDHRDASVLIPLNIIGDAIHNFVDGTIIAATFLLNPTVGLTTALAVFFHEIPREIGDFSIMIYGGMRKSRVAWWNIIGALVSPLGALLTIWLSGRVHGLEIPLLGIAAGNFIYIAAADLIPEIHRERGTKKMVLQVILLLLGLAAIIGAGKTVL